MLKLEDISVDLAGARVLRGVSATAHVAGTVAVVGRNGVGKTTLLRTIMGLVKPKQGRVLFDDEDLLHRPAYHRAELGIGYAPEDRVIFPTLTVEENLRLPCEVQNFDSAEIDDRLSSVLVVVPQLKDMLGRSGAALSGGQGKMVALGRALMIGTRLVLLDEPFQGLAPALARQYGEALLRLRSVRPDLCVMITESNASLLMDIPNQTLTLERGAIESGAIEAGAIEAGAAGH